VMLAFSIDLLSLGKSLRILFLIIDWPNYDYMGVIDKETV
jgi:hypothetical protein